MRFFIIICACLGFAAAAHADHRVALAIGNADYKPHAPNLAYPAADADAIADALRLFDFEVKVMTNVQLGSLRQAIAQKRCEGGSEFHC